ncbi:MAG: ABC transporter ATP-binding protein [Acidimicrobiaceae bacterium]|nr:ABC transporter ATP-binding protein [Acidimicrobiaceae bacterium]|tara:strand:+ start:2483 stop:3202 length:720 start_codon:yes stop_codon:yes gene_type:complete
MSGLEIKDLKVGYKRNQVIHGLNLHVNHGERVALLGANGAGKSTVLKTISGLLTPTEGSITWKDDEIHGNNPASLVEKGVVQVPEGRRIFPGLNVEENLRVANYGKSPDLLEVGLETAYKKFPILEERRKQPAGLLSGGQQQMLSLSRAIVAQPKLLLIDEMSLGLAPLLVKDFYEQLEDLFSNDVTLLIVEQNAGLALKYCSRFYVLRNGDLVLEGDAADYKDDPTSLQSAYLGVDTK